MKRRSKSMAAPVATPLKFKIIVIAVFVGMAMLFAGMHYLTHVVWEEHHQAALAHQHQEHEHGAGEQSGNEKGGAAEATSSAKRRNPLLGKFVRPTRIQKAEN